MKYFVKNPSISTDSIFELIKRYKTSILIVYITHVITIIEWLLYEFLPNFQGILQVSFQKEYSVLILCIIIQEEMNEFVYGKEKII